MPRLLFTLAFLLSAASGCGLFGGAALPEGTPDGALTTDRTAYAPGAEVVLTLNNVFGERIGYNLCTSSLARQTATGWDEVPEDRVCTLELRTLAAGESAEYSLTLPESLAPGVYRYATGIQWMDSSGAPNAGGRTVASNAFRVQN